MDKYFSHVFDTFAAQFEPVDDCFVYRSDLKGPPIKITKEEYEFFISQFRKHLRYVVYGLLFGLILFVLFSVAINVMQKSEGDIFPTYVVYSMATACVGAIVWIWRAPARALKGRPAIGAPRTHQEVRHLILGQISYAFIAFAILFAGFFVYRSLAGRDAQASWPWLSLIGALVIMAGFAIVAFQKWRSGRHDQ